MFKTITEEGALGVVTDRITANQESDQIHCYSWLIQLRISLIPGTFQRNVWNRKSESMKYTPILEQEGHLLR